MTTDRLVDITCLENTMERIVNNSIENIYDSIESIESEVEGVNDEYINIKNYILLDRLLDEMLCNYERQKENNVSIKEYNNIKIDREELNLLAKLAKTSIPTIYVLFLCCFIILSVISIMSVIIGLIQNIWILNFWLECFLVLGSLGMVVTIIVAIWEWRKGVNEKIRNKK